MNNKMKVSKWGCSLFNPFMTYVSKIGTNQLIDTEDKLTGFQKNGSLISNCVKNLFKSQLSFGNLGYFTAAQD